MELRPAARRELTRLSELAAPLQADPRTHVAYLGVDASDIEAELAETTWQEVSAVAVVGDDPVGWLVGDVDPDMGRVWWFGPFVGNAHDDDEDDVWATIASELLTSCRDRLPDGVGEEELAVDECFDRCRRWAATEGFAEDEASHVLRLDGPVDAHPTTTVRPIDQADRAAVIRLHEALFPGTHTTGEQLVATHDATRRRLVVESDGVIAGYVAVELQPDGSGYIDFLGVDPGRRRRGLGADLVRAGVVELRALGADGVALSVRVGSTGARDLYVSLGFHEERLVVPMRRGFSLA